MAGYSFSSPLLDSSFNELITSSSSPKNLTPIHVNITDSETSSSTASACDSFTDESIDEDEQENRIMILNLPPFFCKNDLVKYFGLFGKTCNADVYEGGVGFISYSTQYEALRAQELLNHTNFSSYRIEIICLPPESPLDPHIKEHVICNYEKFVTNELKKRSDGAYRKRMCPGSPLKILMDNEMNKAKCTRRLPTCKHPRDCYRNQLMWANYFVRNIPTKKARIKKRKKRFYKFYDLISDSESDEDSKMVPKKSSLKPINREEIQVRFEEDSSETDDSSTTSSSSSD